MPQAAGMMTMSQLQIDVLAKRPHHDGKGRKVKISLDVGKVDIKEGFIELHVSGANYDRFLVILRDSYKRQDTQYSGTISIPASTGIRLAAQRISPRA
jgi:hypothetical protein